MPPRFPLRAWALLASVALCGCTAERGNFPSLLPRAIESRSDAITTPIPAPAPPDTGLDARIGDLLGRLDQGGAAFDAAARRAEALAARAGGEGSEGWIDAQVSLAELDTLRAPTVGILADLEAMVIDRGIAGLAPYPALDAAVAAAGPVNDAQRARIAAIEAKLAGG